jgi:hypothetical protein
MEFSDLANTPAVEAKEELELVKSVGKEESILFDSVSKTAVKGFDGKASNLIQKASANSAHPSLVCLVDLFLALSEINLDTGEKLILKKVYHTIFRESTDSQSSQASQFADDRGGF